MKWIKNVFLLLLVAALTFIVVVSLRVSSMRHEMDARGPLTLEELDTLIEQRAPVPSELQESAPAQVDARAPEAYASSEKLSTPPRLARALTRDELAQISESRKRNETRFGPVLCPFIEFVTTAGLCAGLSEDGAAIHYFEAANIAYFWTGDWESATRLYRQALEFPLDESSRRCIFVNLAWMEEDSEVATRLLELACPPEEDRAYVLSEAARLAHRTGSRELFEVYISRLEQVSPEQADQIRALSWPKDGGSWQQDNGRRICSLYARTVH